MATTQHHPSWIDVEYGFEIGALVAAVVAFLATMLRTCASVLVNLPHR
jgi:hypothetical protein